MGLREGAPAALGAVDEDEPGAGDDDGLYPDRYPGANLSVVKNPAALRFPRPGALDPKLVVPFFGLARGPKEAQLSPAGRGVHDHDAPRRGALIGGRKKND